MKRDWLVKTFALSIVIMLFFVGIVSAYNISNRPKPVNFDYWYYVGGSGPGNYSTIQSALENVSDWSSIFVYNGTYIENPVIYKTHTKLIGEDKNTTIIDGNGSGNVVSITASVVTINGFTIRNSGNNSFAWDAGVSVSSILFNISGNKIYGNLVGIHTSGSSLGYILYNEIISNRKMGVYLDSGGSSNISGNIIKENEGEGIYVTSSSSNIISENIMYHNLGYSSSNIHLYWSSNYNTITRNSLEHSGNGIYLYSGGCNNNIISYNKINDNSYGIYIKMSNKDNQIFCNDITNGSYGVCVEKYSSVDNKFFHNNFINNPDSNAYDEFTNIYDDGFPSGGNYWDDYNGVDTNGDGIGETDYLIPGGNNADYYPLMYPYGPPHASFEYTILNKSVIFDASESSDYEGYVTNYLWDFGDGANGTGVMVSHDYLLYGYINVTLTVFDNNGSEDSETKVIFFDAPNLSCHGDLVWTNVKPGITLEDNFTVKNIGVPGSYLNWEIESYPEWGTWTFTPENGTNLLSSFDTLVVVKVIVPNESKKKFTGEIKIVNSQDPNNFGLIPVSISTPKFHGIFDYPFIQIILKFFLRVFKM